MPKFKTLQVTNGLSYQNLAIDLDKQGLVLIEGGSGFGKSSIFEILTHIIYGQTSKKSIKANAILNKYDPVNYAGVLEFEQGSNNYRVEQYRSHSKHGNSLFLYENGVLANVKTNRSELLDTQKLVGEKLGMLLQEFYGTVYMCQGYTHAMIEGEPAEKQAYLIKYFGLEKLDRIIQSVKEEAVISNASSNVSSYDALIESFTEDLKRSPNIEDVAKQEASLKKDKQVEVLKSTEILEEKTKLAHALKLLTQYEENKKLLDANTFSHYLLDDLVQLSKNFEANLRLNEEKSGCAASSKRVLSQLAKFEVSFEHQLVEDLDESIAKIKSILTSYSLDQPRLESLVKLERELDGLEETSWDDALEATLKSTQNKLIELKTSFQATKLEMVKIAALDNTCPQCFRPVDAEEKEAWVSNRKEILKSYESTIAKRQKLIANLSEAQTLYNTQKHLKINRETILSRLHLPRQEYESLDIPLLRSELVLTEANKAKILQYKKLQDELAQIKFRDLDVDVLDAEKAQLSKDREEVSKAIQIYSRLGTKPEKVDVARLADLEQAYKASSVRLEALTSELVQLSASIQNIVTLKKSLDSVLKEKEQAKERMVKVKVLNTLHVSLKDLKLLKLHKASLLLTEKLPMYLDLLFPDETVKVTVEDSDSSCDLIFEKAGAQIPLRGLSGGQGRKLGLAILFCFAQMLNKQSNILICDEPMTNLDVKSRHACFDILKDLLDASSNSKLSSIFVMSHEQDLKNQRFDQRWAVKYDGRFSSLVNS